MFQGSGTATSAGFCATGAAVTNSSVVVSPIPQSNCGTIQDPLVSWIPPSVPATCDFGIVNGSIVGLTISSSAVATLSPGRYCGATKVNAATVVLQPGRYYFTDGTLSINATADVTGDGVYIHIDQSAKSLSINGSAILRLTNSSDPDLKGVVLFKSPDPLGAKFKSNINGGSDEFFSGIVYMPKDDFLMGGNTQVRMTQIPDMTLIADTVEFSGGARFEISADLTAGVGKDILSITPSSAQLIQ